MYDIIKSVIDSGRYELTDMLNKIDTMWIQGSITDDERAELIGLARDNAIPENTYAPLQKQIDALAEVVSDLSTRVKTLENNGSESGETEPDPEGEYPPYVQPTGAHDAYNIGDKCSESGKKYVCKMDGCVWPPSSYPDGWTEVVE